MRGDWLGRTGLDSADSASIGRTVVRVLLTLGALFAVFPKAWTLGVGVIGPVLVRARVDMHSVRRGPTTCGTGGDSEVGATGEIWGGVGTSGDSKVGVTGGIWGGVGTGGDSEVGATGGIWGGVATVVAVGLGLRV